MHGDLTSEQLEVVRSIVEDQEPGVFIVNSAPGSGKTTVAIAAIKAHMAARPNDRILMLTFNKNTDESIRQRFGSVPLLSRPTSGGHSRTCVCTVNAAGYSLLSMHNSRIIQYDDAAWEAGLQCDDTGPVATAVLETMGTGGGEPFKQEDDVGRIASETLRSIEHVFTAPRRSMLRPKQQPDEDDTALDDDSKTIVLPFAVQTYIPVRLGLRSPVAFDLVVVDEFQDLQPVDARLCLLFSPRRLVLVGDRYQSIYQWRGARCDEVERLSCAAFRRRVDLHLTRSFRCPTVVADVASRLVGNVVVGREDAADSYVRRCSVKEWTQLASEVSENACMMARTWSRLRAMTESLSAEGIPVILDGVKYFRGPQMMMVSGGSDMVSLLRCPRRVGHFKKRNTDDETTDFGRRAVWFELLSVAARNYGRRIESIYATNKKKTVSLTTVHQMKGREVDHAAFWYEDDKAGKNEDEEINIMYTAITRARIGFAFVG